MPSFEPNVWTLTCGWVFVSGLVIGRWLTLVLEPKKLKKDRDRTLTALASLLSSTEKLNEDVGEHSTALAVAKDDITQLDAKGEVEILQGQLLSNIANMVEANRKLEDELIDSRYQLQQQSLKLDASKREARTDALSDLGNRKAFDEAIAFIVSKKKSKWSKKKPRSALMLVDIDYFKRINDTFGHAAGDRVLVSIGQSLVDCVRPADEVFRIGGDEFAILLHKVQPETIAQVGKRIRKHIERCDFRVENESTVVTMSMGLTIVEPSDTAETLFVRADEALYNSKEQGRNRLTTKIRDGKTELSAPEDDEARPNSGLGMTYEQLKAEMAPGL